MRIKYLPSPVQCAELTLIGGLMFAVGAGFTNNGPLQVFASLYLAAASVMFFTLAWHRGDGPNHAWLASKGLRTHQVDPSHCKRFVRPRIWLTQNVVCPHPDFSTYFDGERCAFCLKMLCKNEAADDE